MTSVVIPADEISWRPAMEAALGMLAGGRAQTVVMIRHRTQLAEHLVRGALNDLVHKGLVSRQEGKPVWYRINDHGQRIIARDPKRFGL